MANPGVSEGIEGAAVRRADSEGAQDPSSNGQPPSRRHGRTGTGRDEVRACQRERLEAWGRCQAVQGHAEGERSAASAPRTHQDGGIRVMTRLIMLEKAWEFIYGTFKIRRVSLMALAALSVILGPFLRVLFLLPQWAVIDIIYVYAGTSSVTGFVIWGAYWNTVKSLIGSVFLGRKYRPREFTPEEYSYYGVTQILNEMGVKKRVRIFETNNPWIEGPFTN